MKGIIAAAGQGTRLRPFTNFAHKSTALVYDKPAISLGIETLINAGASEVIIWTNAKEQIEAVIKDEEFCNKVTIYGEAGEKKFITVLNEINNLVSGENFLILLGDIYLPLKIKSPENKDHCYIYGAENFEKQRISEYGVIEVDDVGKVLSLEEKPADPKGHLINIGLLHFPSDVYDYISKFEDISELNLLDIANEYRKENRLHAIEYKGEHFNVGTHEDLFLASNERRRILKE